MTGLPRSDGLSRCSTDEKNPSMSRWRTLGRTRMDVSVARLAASEVRRRPVSPTIVTMPRLRTVSPSSAGWTRRRAGRGFTYTDADGTRLPSDDALRCKALVIPPAWEELWICPYPNGHIQAVGTDVAGRRQYLYHPAWRLKRDAAKHD